MQILDMVDSRRDLTLAMIAKFAMESYGIAVSERTVQYTCIKSHDQRKDH